jgi:hypothetical protein
MHNSRDGGTLIAHCPSGSWGYLRGLAPTVWFVHDMAMTSKINGCDRTTREGPDAHVPEGGYRINWKVVPGGIAFSEYKGLGDDVGPELANWDAQPWTKIS